METITKPKTKASPNHRVILNEDTAQHLNAWLDQLRESCPGIRVKKQDLVNWLISEKGNKLTSPDLKSIKDRFYDDIELAEWALGQLRSAKARNEKVTLADLIRNGKTSSSEDSPKKKNKTPPKTQTEAPQNEAPPSGLDDHG